MKYEQKKRFTWTRKTTSEMGKVEVYIELLNGEDAIDARRHLIGEDEIRRMPIRALVDTGSQYMCINENIQEVLQLPSLGVQKLVLADDKPIRCEFVGPLAIKFDNRTVHCASAIVLPGSAEPLLGLLPLEEMDVIIDPNRNELIVNPDHPDYAVHRI